LTRYASLLENVYQRYGVQPRFLVSLWGIETEFGRVTGKFPVIQAIATLAYDSRRSGYFRRELIQALRIADEGHVPLGKMRGSWAGAMGQLQFMPSAFHDFGVDFNQDGRVDIWNDLGDAFASAANYLSRSGWSRGHTWGREVKLPPSLDTAMLGLETWKSLSEWQSLGVCRAGGEDWLKNPDVLASILQPDGKEGRAFAVYQNFRAILAWNKSDYFGIAVGTLADQIVGR
jgi:membrane-bound lytic murein transglycosylase B